MLQLWVLAVLVLSPLSALVAAQSDSASFLAVSGHKASFDYVIVGGGTTGLAIATRLAQGLKSVAVIEAGGFYAQDVGNSSYIPADASQGTGASPAVINFKDDWGFITTPQAVGKASWASLTTTLTPEQGLDGRKLHYARGRTLGGRWKSAHFLMSLLSDVSALNYFTYQRPTAGSLDLWASTIGDGSYAYSQFEPFYRKSVAYTPPNNSRRPINASVPSASTSFSPGAGPLHVSFPTWANPFSSFIKLAWQKLGLPVANDFVSGKLEGVQYSMNTINPNGNVRDSSYSSFLQSTKGRLPVYTFNNTMAKRILFTNGSIATGVLVNANGEDFILGARREVIVSAGAFQSPQLLMVSGIGPASTLRQFNIPTISRLEGVGQNLQDHLLFSLNYKVDTPTHSVLGNPVARAAAQVEYNQHGDGILSNPGGEVISWERASSNNNATFSKATQQVLAAFPSDWPTYEYLTTDSYVGNNEDYLTDAPKTSFMYASPSAVLITPQSRGTVGISSIDTAIPPVINPNWLTSPVDIELSLFAFKRVRQMMSTDIMSRIDVQEVLPGQNVSFDGEILAAIRQNAIQLFHASATCKMGKSSDPMAVVDNKGRVFGTKKLRVIDASALPFLPPGHPQSTLYALAEKLSADILASSGLL